MEGITVNELLEDPLISTRAKIETFLAPALRLRPASQITIPAELPHGADMGHRIDENLQPHMLQLQSIQDIRAKAIGIQAVKKLMEKNFETIVEESAEYKALYTWSDRLSLRNNQVKVRPTVHEIYFYGERGIGRTIHNLMRQRDKIRRKVQQRPEENIDRIRFAYPEEFEPKWLLELGKLLGYPDCCVKQYADDRTNEINVEVRAARQLMDTADEVLDTHVYFTGYFFPCNPHCEKALQQGYTWHEALKNLHPDLDGLYEQNIYNNAEMVLRQPELIEKYLAQFKAKTRA